MKNEKMTALVKKLDVAKAKIGIVTAMALTGTPTMVQASSSSSAQGFVFKIADKLTSVFGLIGVFFILSGMFKLVMAYRNDQPEAQAAAAKDIVIGAVLALFKILFWTADVLDLYNGLGSTSTAATAILLNLR